MPFGDKVGSNEDVETFVDTLIIDRAPLSEANLDALGANDINQQLAELSQELHLDTDMETEESEVIIEADELSHVEEEVIEEEIGAHEVEIETERAPTPEEVVPVKAPAIPPLRPLSIAPKPPAKLPIALKTVGSPQLLLLQGGGANQAIKLVSSQGQELNLANFHIGRPVTLKSQMKTIGQPKHQMVMKKIITANQKAPQHQLMKASGSSFSNKIMVVQKSDQMKLMPQAAMPSPTKTITLQQAQEMGLITTTTKLMPQGQSTPKHTVLMNKQKTIKMASGAQLIGQKMQQLKSPTKILPAASTSKAPQQRIIFKNAGHTLLPSAQIIQVAGGQTLNTGQLHQINIPGKGMQYIKFVTATSADTPTSTATITTKSTLTSPPGIVLSELKPSTAIAPKPLKTIAAKAQISSTTGQVVMLPTFVPSQMGNKVAIPRPPPPIKSSPPDTAHQDANLESNGMRPRKPCNCTKSQCLKLYCDCFANGEFCYMCNCMNCSNNLENEDHRQRAIKTCLERNPNAFRPKIGKAKDTSGDSSVRKHTKGCNCKRSGCLKNYCECYEAKIACSNNCKCVGCRNIEDSMDKKSGSRVTLEDSLATQPAGAKVTPSAKEAVAFRQRRSSNSRQAINFITDDVIEATAQCMLTISDSGESNMQDEEVTKSQIIEEFGRCLREIIDYSSTVTN